MTPDAQHWLMTTVTGMLVLGCAGSLVAAAVAGGSLWLWRRYLMPQLDADAGHAQYMLEVITSGVAATGLVVAVVLALAVVVLLPFLWVASEIWHSWQVGAKARALALLTGYFLMVVLVAYAARHASVRFLRACRRACRAVPPHQGSDTRALPVGDTMP